MSKVEARFRCVDVHHPETQRDIHQVSLAPVIGTNDPNDPNRQWSKATPAGLIQMSITNPSAAGMFEVGKTYSVLFNELSESGSGKVS